MRTEWLAGTRWDRRLARKGGLALLATILLLLLGMGTSASSATAAPPLLWQTCEAGSGAGQCNLPRGIAADPENGHVFVADQTNHRVVEFNALGQFIKAWGWDVVASGPGDDTTAPEDQFEICVPDNGDVCKAGTIGGGVGQLVRPQGIALDSEGNVYVAEGDFENRRVQKFDPDGNPILMFGGEVNKTKVEAVGSSEAEENLCPFDPGDECQQATEAPATASSAPGWGATSSRSPPPTKSTSATKVGSSASTSAVSIRTSAKYRAWCNRSTPTPPATSTRSMAAISTS